MVAGTSLHDWETDCRLAIGLGGGNSLAGQLNGQKLELTYINYAQVLDLALNSFTLKYRERLDMGSPGHNGSHRF
jgi:hypothetical protein